MANMKAFLDPAPVRPPGPLPPESIARSYFLMRLLIGLLGFLLPWILLVGDWWLLDDSANWKARGSLSAYYHSGMRDAFVGIFFMVGILLVTYKIGERNRDNLFSLVAGLAAFGVAIFPTGIPDGVTNAHETPLQLEWGQDTVKAIHFTCAAFFVAFVALICLDFARRERASGGPRAEFWYRFHLTMTGLIVVGVALIGVLKWINFYKHQSILIGETVVVIAFGLSWLAKSWNSNALPWMPSTASPD